MSPDNAFLQDIGNDPGDDTVRLIYADWLTEQDDPRGEFIRVQVHLASLSPRDPRWPELNQRQLDLLQAHQEEWARPLRGLVRRVRFRRGFPDDIELTVQEFVDRADELLRVAPFAQVHLQKASSQLHLLADCEALSRVRGLALSYSYLNDGAVQVLALLPQLEGLRVLLLDHNFIRGPGAEALARSPYLSGLTRLDLRGNQITATGRQALADRFGPAIHL
jgi:uncharacterized protein (TIGR02996 family)